MSDTSLFGFRHLFVLGISILAIIIFLIFLIKKKISIKKLSYIGVGVGIISESIKVISYIIANEDKLGGVLPKTDLPFHLCSIQIIFLLVLAFSKNEKIKRTLLSFMLPTCLIGGIAALILPTASARSMLNITIQYFLFHSFIIAFAIYLYFSKEISFTIKDYLTCLICLFVTFFISIYINSILYDGVSNINFMYTVNPPQDNLPFLTKKYGWGVYIAHYTCLAILAITLCYIKPIFLKIKSLVVK